MKQIQINEAIQRIRQMEAIFDILLAAESDPASLWENEHFRTDLSALINYYENGTWLQDYTLDEQDLLPPDLKRGVLSQDAVFDFLERIKGIHNLPGKGSTMNNTDYNWDKTLHIHTTGRDDAMADNYRFPYEPTPYSVLERLSESGYISQEDVVLDYGCGKGRVGFFLAHETGARVIGVEYDDRIYEGALRNRETSGMKDTVDFVLGRAESCPVTGDVNRCYFFNPFSVEILHRVLSRIIDSWYEYPRELLLFFYYPSDEYIAHLMTVDELNFEDEIECDDLFPGKNARERIMIFSLG